ncbi:hypothetical protein PMW_112 [Pseudomonas phage phiPMW]|uniref:Uncharacterized protein n=1 Tax=Pseudomonas phage phiPMW TaxID=1815582 RepID=A0A1S5R1H7_9CAUD|nr:hypothetical protein FDG97_gp112 [Pseudomonas phage phiPMW]ANA49237.1 hypothetical protein PMW_112 [Pseudomonas phage phiPMW]
MAIEIKSIDLKTKDGHDTDIRVSLISKHDGGFVLVTLSDKHDGESIAIYDDEIDNLITILTELKGELK